MTDKCKVARQPSPSSRDAVLLAPSLLLHCLFRFWPLWQWHVHCGDGKVQFYSADWQSLPGVSALRVAASEMQCKPCAFRSQQGPSVSRALHGTSRCSVEWHRASLPLFGTLRRICSAHPPNSALPACICIARRSIYRTGFRVKQKGPAPASTSQSDGPAPRFDPTHERDMCIAVSL
jgi:hypothetical protein